MPEVLGEDACLFLLRSRDLGRIAFAVHTQPEIFPVNYAVEGRNVIFRTGPGTKLDVAPTTPVAFEVDSWDAESGEGWSVVLKGRAEEVTDNPGGPAARLRRSSVEPLAPGGRWHWLVIRPLELTGRRFRVRPPVLQDRA